MSLTPWPVLLSALAFVGVAALVLAAGRVPARLPSLLTGGGIRSAWHRRQAARSATAGLVLDALGAVAGLHERLGLALRSAWVDRELLLAGEPGGLSAEHFLVACELGGAVGAVAGGLAASALIPAAGFLGAAGGLALGAWLPVVWLRGRSDARAARLTRELPHAVDLLALAMEAGTTFQEAARAVVRRGIHDTVAEEFRVFLAEIDLGRAEREALLNLGRRTKSPELERLTAGLAQGLEQGVPLAEILRGQADDLRRRRSQIAAAAAAELPVKMLFPSIVVLAAALLILFGPVIVRAAQSQLF